MTALKLRSLIQMSNFKQQVRKFWLRDLDGTLESSGSGNLGANPGSDIDVA